MLDHEKTTRFYEAINRLAPGDLTALPRHEPEPDARPNCDRMVSRSGGTIQCGWIFAGRHEYDYVIASAHAVWRSPEGTLIDITPMPLVKNLPEAIVPPLRDTEGSMLFLPDSKAFEQPSKFLPLTKNKALGRACRRRNRNEWTLWQDPVALSKRIDKMQRLLAR